MQVPRKHKMNLKKLGDINISIKMGGLEKVQMRIAERIRKAKSVFSKLSSKSQEVSDDITTRILQSKDNFDNFCNNVDGFLKKKGKEFNKNIQQMIDTIAKKTKIEKTSDTVESAITGEMTAEDVAIFLASLWENHEIVQSKFIDTGNEEYGEMALDIKVAINNIEEIKSYLIDHGKHDKVEYDYVFE